MIHLKLNKETDSVIIEKLESVDNIQGYIKSLVLADLKYRKGGIPEEGITAERKILLRRVTLRLFLFSLHRSRQP